MVDIVEALRRRKVIADTSNGLGQATIINDPVCQIAAAEIERLREALKPFAEAPEQPIGWHTYVGGYIIADRDFRRARSALSNKGE